MGTPDGQPVEGVVEEEVTLGAYQRERSLEVPHFTNPRWEVTCRHLYMRWDNPHTRRKVSSLELEGWEYSR